MQPLRPVYVLLVFLALALALRFFSFFPSVIDQDESTYIVIADALMKGYTYQVDFIDTKPIGIFWILAGLQWLFGPSVFGLRLIAAAVLALTAFFLYRAKLSMGSAPTAALAAGVLYLFLNSIFTFYGVSPNTEAYFNLFTALALWLYLSRPRNWAYFFVGLLLGLAFIIKYVVLFDGLAFGLFLLWQAGRKKESWGQAWGRALLMAVGAALPFLVLLAHYRQAGQLDAFWFYTFTVSSRYPEYKPIGDYLKFFLDFNLRFLPAAFFYYYVLFNRHTGTQQRQFGLLWSALVLVAVLATGKFFGHYFIQFMLPFCFLAGEYFGLSTGQLPRWLYWTRVPRIGYPLLALIVFANGFLQYKDYYLKRDYPEEVAAYLMPRLQPGELFYSSNDQITYHLMGQLPPIRYVHPSLFWEPRHINALEIDVSREMEQLMALRPRFVILRQPLEDSRFEPWLKGYVMVEQIGKRIEVWERQ
ncbi:MAG: glycosyltransferase family 39 protein [Phaeodactylibacter sp.]|nr:glycosyltransferase family 39 protein [Phaeodactylibacter sp.]MCB9275416.1 glycosyltransferase family 39 protein [Lewinellaceae bacterium]